jgi:hypothetical protein
MAQTITVMSDGANWEILNDDPDGPVYGVTTVSSTVPIAVEDGPVIDITAGSVTLTLPPVASAAVGQYYIFKDSDGNATAGNITIEGNLSEAIDGALNVVLSTNYDSVTVVNLGDKWIII